MELFIFGWSLGLAAALVNHQVFVRPRIKSAVSELRSIRSAIEPVPVSDPPGPEDCDAEGRCWLHQPHPATPETPEWQLIPARYASTIYGTTHWLPYWALPVPGVEGADD
jgi:hypothetical protein